MVKLCRNSLETHLEIRNDGFSNLSFPHPGLLISRGLIEGGEGAEGDKQKLIEAISMLEPAPFYTRAFELWKESTSSTRFASETLALSGRLYIGQSRDNTLETGITTSHAHGMPLIPGSACKGLARATASRLAMDSQNQGVFDWIFGTSGDDEAESGGLIFHDAWWVPEGKPFVPETVTVHHQEYYKEGAAPATDFDSPVPAPQIAARGKFHFVVEGHPGWSGIGLDLLKKGLKEIGIGSKNSSGYGFFE